MIAKIALLSGLLLTQAFAADSSHYQFTRDIVRQDSREQTLLAVTLDNPVYAASAAGFRDLRITDQDGVETPYLLQKITSHKTVIKRLPSNSKTQTLQKSGDDGIVVMVDLDKDAANADGLAVITAQHDFEYVLQIYGSSDDNDSKNWQLLTDNATIYDYSRYMAVSNHEIDLPNNNYRHFKIVIAQATQAKIGKLLELTRTIRGDEKPQLSEKLDLLNEPLHIDRIEFWHNQTETLPETEQPFDYPVAAFKISQDTEHKTSLIDIDTQNQPLTGFTLKTATASFSRNADVQIPVKHRGETRMQTIGTATLEALHFHDINREQSNINFQEQRQPHYRIVIHNQDNPPLEISSVIGTGHGYQLLFLPQPGKNYQLQYGSDKAEPPHYDTAPIQELLRRGYQSMAANLSPESATTPIEDKFDFVRLLNSKLFLGLAIGLMVVVLGWSLYRAGKRVGDLPK
ncbi:MAG: hypothetical protein Q8N35_12740 [Methylococcaceae bacterium]|nr:hypothetical protein [Methylococcaceae bacterium]MDP3020446.1 hypothetical protein [Methylococcaceae bacterium]MDP3390931.1 hypothetical protein [Methylococcaceae bacterium]MDP3931824.1 hypothetical protein [Methylococcaceae bacterium]MDZ4158127.1 hypothetical protein [Methylococcales bacterium]